MSQLHLCISHADVSHMVTESLASPSSRCSMLLQHSRGVPARRVRPVAPVHSARVRRPAVLGRGGGCAGGLITRQFVKSQLEGLLALNDFCQSAGHVVIASRLGHSWLGCMVLRHHSGLLTCVTGSFVCVPSCATSTQLRG